MPSPNMDPQDYLREFYGSVRQGVREIYSGPSRLVPRRSRRAQSHTSGGNRCGICCPDRKRQTPAGSAVRHDPAKYQWAAELATLLIRVDLQNYTARKIKADAFRQLATTVTNPNWRNWYITAADELCFKSLPDNRCAPFIDPALPGGLTSAGFVAALPPDKWVSSWSLWLKPDDTTQASLGFLFPDEGPAFRRSNTCCNATRPWSAC